MTIPNDYDSYLDSVSSIPNFEILFENETDRGCALLAASILDYELSLLLQKSFIANNKIHKKVFSPNGPLGTFSAKIDMSYLLGHLPKQDYNKMHIIRDIRNQFGHSIEALSFDVAVISQKIKSIALTNYLIASTNRQLFVDVVNKLLIEVHTASFLVHKAWEPDSFEINPKEFIEAKKEEKTSKGQRNGG